MENVLVVIFVEIKGLRKSKYWMSILLVFIQRQYQHNMNHLRIIVVEYSLAEPSASGLFDFGKEEFLVSEHLHKNQYN